MQVSFRTSKGICQGTVDVNQGGIVILDEPSFQILDSLYLFCGVYFKDGWVRLELEDGYYGGAEYQAQEFTPEEIAESRRTPISPVRRTDWRLFYNT